MNTKTAGRVDWADLRDRVDLAAIATRLLGPAPGRRGEKGRRLFWPCPFHPDQNPSFCVDPGKPWWKCFGCGESGDAAKLAMKVLGLTFPEAIAFITGQTTVTPPAPRQASKPPAPAVPTGLSPADALRVVAAAEARLWAPEGEAALRHLTGERMLTPETIRSARLGFVDRVTIPKADGTGFVAGGVSIPWFDGAEVVLLKIRQGGDRRPKYVEASRNPGKITCYPSTSAIKAGKPLIVVEGEFDCLVVAQAVGDRASVITAGSASNGFGPLSASAIKAHPWFVAHDRDDAGDTAANGYPPHARRIRPPSPYKDWCDASRVGINLARWWGQVLDGVIHPPLYDWTELSAWRWGPAVNDPEPGIEV